MADAKDGTEFPVEISLSPLTTERGLQIIAGVRDVMDRRELEREKKRANAYLPSAVEAGPIEGTGIGLTISKRLAEIMRGSVGFRSQVGQGSEFWIEERRLLSLPHETREGR